MGRIDDGIDIDEFYKFPPLNPTNRYEETYFADIYSCDWAACVLLSSNCAEIHTRRTITSPCSTFSAF